MSSSFLHCAAARTFRAESFRTFAKARLQCQRPAPAKPGARSSLHGACIRRYAPLVTMDQRPADIAIVINGERREVPAGLTVRALLDHIGLAGLAAVERNRELVPRARHAEVVVERGDVLEIVHLVGGG